MAIDTPEKRKAAANVSRRSFRGVNPNASKPLAWRQEVGWGYSGIAVGSVTTWDVQVTVPGYDLSVVIVAGTLGT